MLIRGELAARYAVVALLAALRLTVWRDGPRRAETLL
jgi:hypothetical protein